MAQFTSLWSQLQSDQAFLDSLARMVNSSVDLLSFKILLLTIPAFETSFTMADAYDIYVKTLSDMSEVVVDHMRRRVFEVK